MMLPPLNIEERKPIWIAVSEFYLDTELDHKAIRHIAFTIIDSPYNLQMVKWINKYEIFPVLYPNLLSVAGEWAGFDEDWLVATISTRLKAKNLLDEAQLHISYAALKWMFLNYWKKLETIYQQLKEYPNSFIVVSREAFMAGIRPFQFEKSEHPLYRKLQQVAFHYRDTRRLQDFCRFLDDGYYATSTWAAFFLMEIFELGKKDKLVELHATQDVFTYCYHLLEGNFQDYEHKDQVRNCGLWLERKRIEYELKHT